MTEAGTLELAATLAETTHSAFTIYISFTFGFLVTAFLVGSKLTRFQALAGLCSLNPCFQVKLSVAQ